jgi:hypothetical protein
VKLHAQSGSVTRDISLRVLPAELGELKLDIQPTQFIGNPIIGPATIFALDIYGNLKTDFDASKTPVQLTVDTGAFNSSRIESKESFKNGVADISKMNIVYDGHSGKKILTVSSNNISASANLLYNGIEFEPDKQGQLDTVYVGEAKTYGGIVFNRGNLTPLYPVDIVQYFQSCSSSCYDSSGFRALGPDSSLRHYISVPTDSLSLDSEDTLRLFTISRYLFDGDTISVGSRRYIRIIALQGLVLKYVESSFSIDTIIAPSIIRMISLQFEANIDFDPSRYAIVFYPYYYSSGDDEDDDYGGLEGTYQSGRIDGRILTLNMSYVEIPDIKEKGWFDEGYRSLNGGLSVYEREGRHRYWRQLYNFDSVYFAFAADLAYVPNSIKPKAVSPDRTVSFEFDINLTGKIGIVLDSVFLKNDSAFQLVDEDTILYSKIFSDSQILVPGINHIRTGDIHIPVGLINEKSSPRLIIKGSELYSQRTDTVSFGDERISVSGLPQIKITSAELQTVNPPFVNYGQEFSVNIKIANLSSDTIPNAFAFIMPENSSDTLALSDLFALMPADTIEISLPLVADSISNPAKTYRAFINAPNITILPADDNTAVVAIQSPAEIELEYILMGTYREYVEFGQSFSLLVKMVNNGEAMASSGEVSISAGDFGIENPSFATIDADSSVQWNLTAPSISGDAELEIKLTRIPQDRNTGQPAGVKIGELFVPIIIESSQAELVVNGIIGNAPLVIEGTTSELFTVELYNNTNNPLNEIALKSIDIELTDRKGNIISPDSIVRIDSTFFIAGEQILATAEIDDKILRLVFTDFKMPPGGESDITFRTKFNEKISLSGFALKVENQDFKAIFISGPRLNQPVPVRGKIDNNFLISGNFTVTPPSLGQSLMVRNNPFNPHIEKAEITYNLEKDTDVSLRIFTLTGEKVYESEYASGMVGAKLGNNPISWNGQNDKGRIVLNGVYILIIKDNSTGQTYSLKLAVIK